MNTIKTEANQYVTFKIGEEDYGIDIMIVKEIVRYSPPTRIYNSNPVIVGVTNFRGKIIPIVDMRKKFNLKEGNYDEFTVIVVIEHNDKTMGLIADRISDILSIDEEEIQFVDKEFEADIKTKHLKGMAKVKEQIILILNPLRVIEFKDIEEIESIEDIEDIEDIEENLKNNNEPLKEGESDE